MAKKAPMSLGTMTASIAPETAAPIMSDNPAPTRMGRPRTLPDTVKTISIRVAPEVQRALRQAALNHDRTIQSIILDGIADQLARLGVPVGSHETDPK